MSIWKKIAVALVIGTSMGVFSTYSTVAVAAEDRAGSRQATVNTIKSILEGIEATKNKAEPKEIKRYYFEARQEAKDITGETIATALQHANDALMAVSRSLKPNEQGEVDYDVVLERWQEALKMFNDIKKRQI